MSLSERWLQVIIIGIGMIRWGCPARRRRVCLEYTVAGVTVPGLPVGPGRTGHRDCHGQSESCSLSSLCRPGRLTRRQHSLRAW